MRKVLLIVLSVLLTGIDVLAQQSSQDSLVVLISSKSAQAVDIDGASYRKVVGPARFLHNNTYLLCDTAYWNIETKIIDAWGNVSLLQEETVLTSEKLTYLIDQDLARFRGSVVQLTDKDHNTLRTRHLDYNTKDSVAVFMNGGSMRDKDGQIIESLRGTYDSKIKKFTFVENVNMFSDSIFVKTSDLVYESEKDLATFKSMTDVWKDDNMLTSQRGWYDKGRELFFFKDDVHIMTDRQEGWCDTLYFRRNTSDVEMLGNAQVTDTTRNIFALAGRIDYIDSLAKVTLTRDPAVISQTKEQDESIDTLYLGAKKLVYFTIPRYKVDSLVVVEADKRLAALDVDPVGEYRKKAAEAAAKALEEAIMNDPNLAAKKKAEEMKREQERKEQEKNMAEESMDSQKEPLDDPLAISPPLDSLRLRDSLAVSLDSLAITDTLGIADSLAIADPLLQTDSLTVQAPKDTTEIGFLEAIRDVRIYKKNLQIVCDSLLYSDLDSLARLFKKPLIWQEARRQYSADSVSLVVRGGALQKASLMSEAFVTIEEDTTHYDQIKGAEMLAFFDKDGALERFDVLGGATSLFYVEENKVLATVNKTDSKMLSANFKDGELQRIYYYDQPKNDGFPKAQLTREDRSLKGFNWQPERRPVDRNAVTTLELRPSQRKKYYARPKAEYKQTDIYFPGYIGDVYRQIAVRDSLRKVRERDRELAKIEAKNKARLDSIALQDSLFKADSLFKLDSIAKLDSLKIVERMDSLHRADSLKQVKDSLAVADSLASVGKVLTKEELRALKKAEKAKKREKEKAEREESRRKRREEKEKRWAELDKRDEEKAKAKEEKRKAKERERKRKALIAAAKEAEKDAKVLEAYIRKYQEEKEKGEVHKQ